MKTLQKLTPEGVEALVRVHQDPLRAFLHFLGCPRGQLDDVIQETFLALLRGPFEDRSPEATAGWLRRTARNHYLRALEQARREPPFEDLEEAEAVWVAFEGGDGGARYLEALTRCLDSVGGKVREVLGLRYQEALARAEIARRLELTESGVNSILVRARKQLRACVERRLGA